MVAKVSTEIAGLPPWAQTAYANLGLTEGKGAANNSKVIAFYKDVGHPEIKADSVAWCAAFVGGCLARNFYPVPPVDNNLMARSYRTYGKKSACKPGAIAVLPRGKPPYGHVCIVTKVYANGTYDAIGGNQSMRGTDGAVTIAKGLKIKEALDFRWPVAPNAKALKEAGSTEINEAETLQKLAVAAPAVGTAATVAEKTMGAGPTVTDPGLLDKVKSLQEPVGVIQTVTEGTVAMGNLLMANLWLIGVIALSAGLWWLATQRKKKRIAKHAAGVPLSTEVA